MSTPLLWAALVIADAQASLPLPALATDGAEIPRAGTTQLATKLSAVAWRRDTYLVRLSSDATSSVDSLAIHGYLDGSWSKLADLNDGAAVSMTATSGADFRVIDLGLYDRLAVSGSPDAGNITVVVIPIE